MTDCLDLIFAVPFDYPVLMEPTILGQSIRIDLESGAAHLRLPALSGPPEAERGGLIRPNGVPEDLKPHTPGGWGHLFMSGTTVASVSAVAIAIHSDQEWDPAFADGQVGGPDTDEARAAIATWFDSFVHWLWVLTSQSLNPQQPDPKFFHRRSTVLTHAVTSGGRSSLPASGFPSLTIHVENENAASERVMGQLVLEKAAAHASSGGVPPFSMELLSLARIACRQLDRRRAIIDAGTAAEAALTNLLGLPVNHRQTLGQLATGASIQLPNDIKTHLVQPRNDAVHRGLVPDSSKTQRAIEIVEELVSRVEPQLIPSLSIRATSRPQRQDLLFIKPP